MKNLEQQVSEQVRCALEKCFAQIRLARATELAQAGRFVEAEAVLMPTGQLPDEPRELDLLARMAARQGHASSARRAWEAALRKDPQNPDYNECLQRLSDLPRIRISFETVIECLVWAASAFGIATLLYVFLARK